MSTHPTWRRWLALVLLAAGPLHAQAVMLCDRMDVPSVQSCCCHDPEPPPECEGKHGEMAAPPEREGCCEQTLELSFQPEALAVAAKPLEAPERVDPPVPLQWRLEAVAFAVTPVALPVPDPVPSAGRDDTRLFLLTQRLRI